ADDAAIRSPPLANGGGDLNLRPAANASLGVRRDICSHPPAEDGAVEAVAPREVHARQVHLAAILYLLRRVTVSADADGLHKVAAALHEIRPRLRERRHRQGRNAEYDPTYLRQGPQPGLKREAHAIHRSPFGQLPGGITCLPCAQRRQ